MSTRPLLLIVMLASAAAPAAAQGGAAEQLAGLGATLPHSEDGQRAAHSAGGQASAMTARPVAGDPGSSTAHALANAARWGAVGGALGAGAATLAVGAWVMVGGALAMRSIGCCSGPAPGMNTMMMATPFVGLALMVLPAAVTGGVLYGADAGLGAIVAGAVGASAVFVLMLPAVALSTVLLATATYQRFGGGGTHNGYGLSGGQIGGSALVLAATSAGAGVVAGVLTAGVAAGGALLDVTLATPTAKTDPRSSEVE